MWMKSGWARLKISTTSSLFKVATEALGLSHAETFEPAFIVAQSQMRYNPDNGGRVTGAEITELSNTWLAISQASGCKLVSAWTSLKSYTLFFTALRAPCKGFSFCLSSPLTQGVSSALCLVQSSPRRSNFASICISTLTAAKTICTCAYSCAVLSDDCLLCWTTKSLAFEHAIEISFKLLTPLVITQPVFMLCIQRYQTDRTFCNRSYMERR